MNLLSPEANLAAQIEELVNVIENLGIPIKAALEAAQKKVMVSIEDVALYPGVLDSMAVPAAAVWSFQRVCDGYAGPCLRVRRDSDSATSDIGFSPDGALDVAGLTGFVGSANGFVTAWYDQASNPPASIQAPRTPEIQIVSNGVFTNPSSRFVCVNVGVGVLPTNAISECIVVDFIDESATLEVPIAIVGSGSEQQYIVGTFS